MESRNYNGRSLQRNYSMPNQRSSSSWFRENSAGLWSPKGEESDPDFDSDEENTALITGDYPMRSPENSNDTKTQQNFVMNKPLLSSVLSSSASSSSPTRTQAMYTPSSRSLQIGRPMKSVGLKDLDLTGIPRAGEIRRAKEANKNFEKGHIFTPIRQHSSPAVLSTEHQDIWYQGTSYGTGTAHKDNPRKSNMVTLTSNSSSMYADGTMEMDIVPYGPKETYYINEMTHNAISTQPQEVLEQKRGRGKIAPPKSKKEIIIYSQENPSLPTFSPLSHDVAIDKYNDVIVIPDDDNDASPCDIARPSYPEAGGLKSGAVFRKRKSKKSGKKISSSAGFSDDEEELETCAKDKAAHSTSTQIKSEDKHNIAKGKKQSHFRSVFFTLILSLITASWYLYVNPHGLCLEGEFKANLTGLEMVLQQDFYGQHLAKKIILSSLKSHLKGNNNKPLVLSLHGWTGTGKNYITEITAHHLFKHGIQSSFIHKFIIPLHFPHPSLVPLYRKQLQHWIAGNVTKCNKGGLFIFDEMDKIPHGLVDVLKPFLDSRRKNFHKIIFMFLSNSGSKMINQHALEHYQRGEARDQIGLVALERSLHKIAESDPKTWYKELAKFELIDHFVPFLPLERMHIKQCIRKDLRGKGYKVLEEKVTEIADEMTYVPPSIQLFSASGCKKVSSKVDVAVG